MSAVDTQFYQKKKSSTFYISLGFLALTILGTLGLYLFNSSIKDENATTLLDIENLERVIEEEQSDKSVQVYSIYSKHKALLDNLATRSQIPLFVSHLKKNFLKYGIDGKGFDYSEGRVNLEMTAKTDDRGYAYQKIVKLLTEYAADEKALFDIGPVTTFTGHDKILYSTEFNLK